MPNTQAMIADQGLTCTEFMMPTALCCPSRASFLTGKYARHDRVRTNTDPLFGPTVANHLHESGYYTGLIGKYLNSSPGNARPEYDYWAAWIRGYVNPTMNIFGTFAKVPGYLTYIQRDYALDFLNKGPSRQAVFSSLHASCAAFAGNPSTRRRKSLCKPARLAPAELQSSQSS